MAVWLINPAEHVQLTHRHVAAVGAMSAPAAATRTGPAADETAVTGDLGLVKTRVAQTHREDGINVAA